MLQRGDQPTTVHTLERCGESLPAIEQYQQIRQSLLRRSGCPLVGQAGKASGGEDLLAVDDISLQLGQETIGPLDL
jgi:hypothetical protein